MNTHGIAHLWKAIRQRANGRNLSGLNAGMQERFHSGITPALSNCLEVLLKGSEDDVTVTVDQRRCGHWILKRAFRIHSAGLETDDPIP